MQTNYHTHTDRCMHATGREEDYIQNAIKQGYDIIGFSDHGPWPYHNGYTSSIRMPIDQQTEYEASIRMLAERYQNDIKIFLGYEFEYFPEFLPYLKETKERVDYLILGNHFAGSEQSLYFGSARKPSEIQCYADAAIEGMSSGLFAYLAHPDLFLYSYPKWDADAIAVSKRICKAAKELNFPLEYNLCGIQKQAYGAPGLGYPYRNFWEIACTEGCEVIIGCDAHQPQALDHAFYQSAEKTLQAMDAKLIYELQLK